MQGRSGVSWVPAWTVLVAVAGYGLHHDAADRAGVHWMLGAIAGVFAAVMLVGVSFALDRVAVVPHRCLAALSAGVWVALVGHSGFTQWRMVALAGGVGVVALLEWLLPAPPAAVRGEYVIDQLDLDRRPAAVRSWEGTLNRLAKRAKTAEPLAVRTVTRWPSGDGEQVHVDLPEDMTARDLADMCDRIAGARHLPQGCVVRVLEAEHQGAAVLDVMLRDCLADARTLEEPTTQASINDEFDIATAPGGDALTVCLRQKSMVIGGTVGSGKTTLLHRIIMRLARCVDALIWVVDLNGGGVAAPWVAPWARGEADAPVVDWVADNEAEAAVMLAVARAVAKDRKTNREATRRKRAANTTVLPVDRRLPAIVIITDEGGEVRQAAGLLGTLVDKGIARTAQIARAEGVRVVMSVLRGTGDLMDKALRAVVGIRICLRMDEEGEYDHVLGVNPGRARLLHVGSAYVYRTDTDQRPILARTVNVLLDHIDTHAMATAHLRPALDAQARAVAARLTVRDVLDGRDPLDHRDIARLPVMRYVAEGRAYEGRWERKEAMLAEMRGEDLPEVEVEREAPIPDRPTVAEPGSAIEALLLGTGVIVGDGGGAQVKARPADIDAEAAALLSADHLKLIGVREVGVREVGIQPQPEQATTAREVILLVLADARPDALTGAQVHARVVEYGCEVTKSRVYELLKTLVEKGSVRQVGSGYEVAPE